MDDFDLKNVEENTAQKPKKAKKPVYKKGKFPHTVLHIAAKTLYVRKALTINRIVKNPKTGEEKFLKQTQIWKKCDPQTLERVTEILTEIKDELRRARSGKPRPLSNFKDVVEKFEIVEFSEAVFRDGKKAAGNISAQTPKTFIKNLIVEFGGYEISEITFEDVQALFQHY